MPSLWPVLLQKALTQDAALPTVIALINATSAFSSMRALTMRSFRRVEEAKVEAKAKPKEVAAVGFD